MSTRVAAPAVVTESKTVAATLSGARTHRKLSLAQVAAASRIPERYVRLFEETPVARIPDDAYTRIYLKAYAKFLGLDPAPLVQRFQDGHKTIAETAARKHPTTGVAASQMISLPRVLRGVMFGLIACGVFAYLGLSLATSFAPPQLVLLTPDDGGTVRGSSVGVTGTTEPEVSLTINGLAAPVDANGNWGDVVELREGKNDIVVTAKKKYGKPTTITRTVIAE